MSSNGAITALSVTYSGASATHGGPATTGSRGKTRNADTAG
jgi:hypothetical protein